MDPLDLGRLRLEPGRRTYVMGVLNVTPDSFSGDGVPDPRQAVDRGRALLAEGADILDVGGESTRPGAARVPLIEELRRVLPVIERLAAEGAVLSVDTMKAEVALRAMQAGVRMVNDISALRADPAMGEVVADAGVPVVLMHGWGRRPVHEEGGDLMGEIHAFLSNRIQAALRAGLAPGRILVDPGFGFGKTVRENLEVLRRLGLLRGLGCPILIGPSRKGTIGRVLDLPIDQRLEGTAAAVAVAIMHGADIVRVHDVRAMVRVARMTDAIVRDG